MNMTWSDWKYDVSYSTSPPEVFKRFRIMRATAFNGGGALTVTDAVTHEMARPGNPAAAKAWAIGQVAKGGQKPPSQPWGKLAKSRPW